MGKGHSIKAGLLAATAAVALAAGAHRPAEAFTQSVGGSVAEAIPMGHEWITRIAAAEVLAYPLGKAPDVIDPNDPRKGWRPGTGAAWNTSLSTFGAQTQVKAIKASPTGETRYESHYAAVYDAIIGERWVDLGGYNVATAFSCWDAVAQEPAQVQYDHFMRRYDDNNGAGGVTAAVTSQQRFVDYFVKAVMAPYMNISVYDGGLTSDAVTVNRNYFLFGRAVHEFQDSFSSEHTVRIPVDNFIEVRQVKSYICALGSEQHTHSTAAIFDYSSGDVVWKLAVDTRLDPTWGAYKPSNMKPTALVAVEATKDLWAAFIRSMGVSEPNREAMARSEARVLVEHWLSFNGPQMSAWYDDPSRRDNSYVLAAGQGGKGDTQTQCMEKLKKGPSQIAYVRELEATQRKCLYNAIPWKGYEDQADPQLHIWYSWRWKNGPVSPQLDPPAGWQIPNLVADSGQIVRIKSLANQQYMTAPSGVTPDSLIYNRPGAPLDFVQVGQPGNITFRSVKDPLLFLDYRAVTGAVKLFAPGALADPANYDLKPAGQGQSIRSTYWNQYIWLSGDEPYLTHSGNPAHLNAQWSIEPQK